MKVYVLFHHDIEEGTLRGIYFRREDAERDRPVEVFTYKPGHRDRQDEGEQCTTWSHGEWCCAVEEWEVRREPIGASMLPAKPYEETGLIPRAAIESLMKNAVADIAYRETIKAKLEVN